ncbi:MAG: CBS domain-containing protein [Ectothiorhodospiraceae bacterium]|nr:CBS domain-containing protein [Chromatiales bacterium]MCP5153762.1 CBS domain-containing protein [Ectothiorhodospiraceae bacterium]
MDLGNLRVGDVMTTEVRAVGRNDALSLPDDLMRDERIRHLPVLDSDGVLCGILTQRDLFRGALLRSLGFGSRAEERLLETMVVKDAMTEDPLTATPEMPLHEAARLMLERKVGCLPVVDGERLVGILTESDFVAMVARD